MNKINLALITNTLIALSLSVSPVQANADDLFDLPFAELLKLEVTSVASLFEESELYVGSSVSKVTEAQWRRSGAEKTFDAIDRLPGIYVSEYFHGMMIPSFRGLADSNQYNSFLVMLDGMPVNNYSSASAAYGLPNFALGNLESIELIRGPGSALYGANAFNGVAALNTWRSDRDEIQLFGELGSFGYYNTTGRLRYSFTDGVSLTSALSVSGVDDEEIESNYTPSLGSPQVEAQVSGEYSNISSSHKLAINNFELGLYYSRNDVKDSFGAGDSIGFPNGNHTDGIAVMKALKMSYSAEVAAGWNADWSLFYTEDQFNGSFGIASPGGPPQVINGIPTFDWDSKDTHIGFSSVLKKALGEGRTQVVLGYNFDYLDVEEFSVAVTGTGDAVESDPREVHGFMAQLEQRFFDDKMQVIVGGRFDRYSDFGDTTTPRMAIIFHPVENSALKLLYGNAYRAPSLNEQVDNGIVIGGGEQLSAEQIDTYELVWIQQGENWRYSLSAYESKIRGSISIGVDFDFDTNPPGLTLQYANNLDATARGLEFEGSIQWGDWSLAGNVSTSETEMESEDLNGIDSFPAYPNLMANVQLGYRFSDSLRFTFSQQYYNDRLTVSATNVTPNYINEALPSWNRTDINVQWFPNDDQHYELYFTMLDVFDNADKQSALNLVEVGRGTPGRKVTAGVKLAF